jgi:hypothetical protein
LKKTTTILLASSALALAACGGDDETSEESEASATPETALQEIGTVRAGLEDAETTYADGKAQEAATAVEDVYLEHFELVEGPLEEVDGELNEELEDQIREELVEKMESNATVAEVKSLIAEIEAGLDEAEKALSGAGAS